MYNCFLGTVAKHSLRDYYTLLYMYHYLFLPKFMVSDDLDQAA